MDEKIKFGDLTFIIPCRLDSIVRLENLIAVIGFLQDKTNYNIIVIEADSYNNSILKRLLPGKIRYIFYRDDDPVFYRTHYINLVLKDLNTSFAAIWDTDIIVPAEQIFRAVELLRNNEADFVYPYDKYFLDTSPILRRMYLKEGNIEVLLRNMKKMKEMYPPNPLGGAFLANLKTYKESGLENESFYGWGLEDGERYYRWQNMGYRIKRVPGPLFHLSHPRGQNSNFHDVDQHLYKKKEVISVKRNKILKPDITAP